MVPFCLFFLGRAGGGGVWVSFSGSPISNLVIMIGIALLLLLAY